MPIFGLHPAGLLETIFEEIGIAVAVVDREHNVVFANRTAVDLLGESPDQPFTFREWRTNYRLEDRSGHEISFDESAVMRAFQGERVEAQEMRAILPSGASKWLLAWAYPFSAMGLSGVIAFVVDETAEVELRRTVNQLQRLETLGAVAAGLAHNLNNLLETITLSVEAAKTDDILSDERQDRLNQISTAASSAAGLILPGADDAPPQPQPVRAIGRQQSQITHHARAEHQRRAYRAGNAGHGQVSENRLDGGIVGGEIGKEACLHLRRRR